MSISSSKSGGLRYRPIGNIIKKHDPPKQQEQERQQQQQQQQEQQPQQSAPKNKHEGLIPELRGLGPWIAGIDEAGRGPALGPMVYGIAAFPKSEEENFKKYGINDSKQLTEAERQEIFDAVQKEPHFYYRTVSVSPKDISEGMNKVDRISLNQMAFEAARSLLVQAFKDLDEIEHVYIDLISPAKQYEQYIRQLLPKIKMTIAAKADATYLVTGAASIMAKVTRDNALQGVDCSGYPSDKKTIAYLEEHCDKLYGFNVKMVRSCWQTCERIMDSNCVKCVWQLKQKDEKNDGNIPRIGALGQLGFCTARQ